MVRLAAAFLCLATPAMAVAADVPAEPARDGAVADELVRLERERLNAYVSGDAATLERQLASEAVHVNFRGDVTGRAEEFAFYRQGTFSLTGGALEEADVRSYGDTAVLLGLVRWDGAAFRPNPATTVDLSGRYRVTRVYVRRDGRWQLASSHASRIP